MLYLTLGSGTEKQAAAGWGATEGEAELKDEQAGEAIAKTEQKEALVEDAAGEEPAEPEDKNISYSDYLAQLAEKKLDFGSANLKAREANEGSSLTRSGPTPRLSRRTKRMSSLLVLLERSSASVRRRSSRPSTLTLAS